MEGFLLLKEYEKRNKNESAKNERVRKVRRILFFPFCKISLFVLFALLSFFVLLKMQPRKADRKRLRGKIFSFNAAESREGMRDPEIQTDHGFTRVKFSS